MCVYVCASIHTHTYVYISICTHKYVFIYIYTHTFFHTHINIIYIYIWVHTAKMCAVMAAITKTMTNTMFLLGNDYNILLFYVCALPFHCFLALHIEWVGNTPVRPNSPGSCSKSGRLSKAWGPRCFNCNSSQLRRIAVVVSLYSLHSAQQPALVCIVRLVFQSAGAVGWHLAYAKNAIGLFAQGKSRLT